MRLMMFDAVKFRADPVQVASKRLGQRFRDALKFQEDFGASARERGHAQRIEYFPPQPRVGVSRHGHVVETPTRGWGGKYSMRCACPRSPVGDRIPGHASIF